MGRQLPAGALDVHAHHVLLCLADRRVTTRPSDCDLAISRIEIATATCTATLQLTAGPHPDTAQDAEPDLDVT